MAEISTKPYMIRAIYEWCCDSGHTPYLLVKVGGRARVPMQHVNNGEIVLNVSPMATHALQMGNELIQFEARFNGVPEHIVVPVGNVAAIYARETGSGMAFSPEIDEEAASDLSASAERHGEGGEVVDFGGAARSARKPDLKAVPSASAPAEAEAASSAEADTSEAGTSSSGDQAASGRGTSEPEARPGRDSAAATHGAAGQPPSPRTGRQKGSAAAQAREGEHVPSPAGPAPDSRRGAGQAADAGSAPPAAGRDDAPDGERPPPGGPGKPKLVRVK